MSENSRIFMRLNSPSSGDILGECTVDGYEDWIELDSWDWKLGRAKEEDAVPEPSVLTFTKLMDRSTTAMLSAMLAGEKLSANIVVDDASEDLLFELTVELQHVAITDYKFSTQISDKGATVNEDWTFNYRFITFHHRVDETSGTKKIQLERPAGAGTQAPSSAKKAEWKKLALELLAGDVSEGDLNQLWQEILKNHEEEKKRPDGKPLAHAGEKGK